MIQHPIPQNVSAYQFRLVGDMTLKQFFELCIGLGAGIFFYITNLPFIIKWPLIIICVIGGFAAAFLPIAERPLEEWVVAFIKAIYRPTHFTWKKQAAEPTFFTHQPSKQILPEDAHEVIQAHINRKRAGLSSFLQTIRPSTTTSTLENQEEQQLDRVLTLFTPTTPQPPTPPVLEFKRQAISTPTTVTIPSTPLIAIEPTTTPATPTVNTPLPGITVTPSSTLHKKLPTLPPTSPPTPPAKTSTTSQLQSNSLDLPFPASPTNPNTLVGMVLSADAKIIENAIIEIRDSKGLPVRATKTNKLGQFFSTTPLKNGTYEVETDAPSHKFAILKLELDGHPVPPLKIQAT